MANDGPHFTSPKEVKCACGATNLTDVTPGDLQWRGMLLDVVDACSKCWETFRHGLEWWREEFRSLVARGYNREAANKIIIARMNAGEKPPPLRRESV